MLSEMTESDHRFGQCRCCLNVGYHKDIAEPYHRNGARETYLETFLKCFNLVLSKDKKLINMICESCINRLNDATEFKAMVVESERQLLSRTESVSSNTELTYVGQDNDMSVQKDHNNTITKKEEDNDWNNDGDEMETQDAVEEQATESVDNDGNIESATEVRRNGPLRQLQVKLTRLPTFLLKLFIKKPYGNNSLEADPDLGLHTELDIKWEPEGELKEEPQDCGVDFVLATDDDGGPSSDEHELKTNRSSAIPFKDADTGSSNSVTRRNETSKVKQDVNKHVTTNTTDNSIVIVNEVRIDGKFDSHLGNKDQDVNNDLDIHAEVYSCNTGNYTTKTENLLKLHIQAHTAAKKYTCDTCSYIATTKNKLICHIRQHTDVKPLDCELYSTKFVNSEKTINKHVRTHTDELRYACEICDKKFKQSSNLKNHVRTHTGEKPYECKICSKRFTENSTLQRHIRTHTGEKPYACEICDKKFSQSNSLKYHVKTHTSEKPYECKICSKRFIENISLQWHIRTHTGEKPYACEICDKKFIQSGNLKYHIRTHTDEKPYACDICDKKFKQSSILKYHIRTHTREKPYACQICDKKFNYSSNLRIHVRTHTGEKPYVCEICDKKFNQSSNLKTHVRTHTGEKS